jgi:hypothetical protein
MPDRYEITRVGMGNIIDAMQVNSVPPAHRAKLLSRQIFYGSKAENREGQRLGLVAGCSAHSNGIRALIARTMKGGIQGQKEVAKAV